MIRKLLTLLAFCLFGLSPLRAIAQGSIFMSSTGYPDSVAINLNISDIGLKPECAWLGVYREATNEVITTIPRHVGTYTAHIVDRYVTPNTLYCYRVGLYAQPSPFPVPLPWPFCPGGGWPDMCDAFNCFYDIETCSITGSDPVLLGHGYLSSQGTIPNEIAANLVGCVSPQYPLPFCRVLGTAASYIDSGIAVDVYGSMERGCIPQGVWTAVAQAATPHPCVVATTPTTWGAVKSRYRN